MKSKETPPIELNLHEEVEQFKDERELPIDASQQQIIKDVLEKSAEKKKVSKEDELKIKKIKEGLTIAPVIKKVVESRPNGAQKWKDERSEEEMKPWYKRVATFLGFAGIVATTALPKESAAKNFSDSLDKKGNKIEHVKSDPNDSLEKQSKIAVYTKSKTKEGGVTPTGRSNSFLENEERLSEKDLLKIAKKFGFRTGSSLELQTDIVEYTANHRPDIIKMINEKYGRTALGKKLEKEGELSPAEIDVKGLEDGDLGVRIWEIAKEISKTPPEEKKKIPETVEEQPKGGYVVNVRGDEKGEEGVYYFFEDEKDFMKATDKIGGFASREVYANGTGQATVNMSDKVYEEFHAKQNKKLLGQGWLLDQSNPKRYRKVKTVASYEEGLTKK